MQNSIEGMRKKLNDPTLLNLDNEVQGLKKQLTSFIAMAGKSEGNSTFDPSSLLIESF